MSICVSICEESLDLQYAVLATGEYTITIVSALGERYIATLTLTLGDDLIIDPFPPINESMSFKCIIEIGGVVEEVIYFNTYPYELILA